MSAKKVVTFGKCLREPAVGYSTILSDVKGHYALGDQPVVTTSYVLSVSDDGNTIETKNTIYKKET